MTADEGTASILVEQHAEVALSLTADAIVLSAADVHRARSQTCSRSDNARPLDRAAPDGGSIISGQSSEWDTRAAALITYHWTLGSLGRSQRHKLAQDRFVACQESSAARSEPIGRVAGHLANARR